MTDEVMIKIWHRPFDDTCHMGRYCRDEKGVYECDGVLEIPKWIATRLGYNWKTGGTQTIKWRI